MTKKKVLLVAENHDLASGFGTYAKNLLQRLHDSGKYELAEFGIYANISLGKNVPWKFYANAPEEDDPQDQKIYIIVILITSSVHGDSIRLS